MKAYLATLLAIALTATAAKTAPFSLISPTADSKVTLPVVRVQEKKVTQKKKAAKRAAPARETQPASEPARTPSMSCGSLGKTFVAGLGCR